MIHSRSRIRPAQLRPEELGAPALQLRGVTVREGSTYLFDEAPAPRMERDTVYGSREGVPYRIPRSQVAELTVAVRGGNVQTVQATSMEEAADRVFGRRVLGVDLVGGAQHELDDGYPVAVRGDTLFGTVQGQARAFPFGDVDRVRVVRTNVPLSILATTAFLAAGTAIVWKAASEAGSLDLRFVNIHWMLRP